MMFKFLRILFFAVFTLLVITSFILTNSNVYSSETIDQASEHNEGVGCNQCHNKDGKLSRDIIKMTQTKNTSPKCAGCHAPEGITEIVSKENYTKKANNKYSSKVIKQEMIIIPAGEFLMGNNGRVNPVEGPGNNDETPLHKVTLPAFKIDKYEVTNAHYRQFVDATNYKIPRSWKNGFPEDKINHPVVYVNWQDAFDYCKWNGKRLPSEREWEKAARGDDARSFPWGPEFNVKIANTPQYWLRNRKKGSTLPVGSFPEGVSPYGLLDMSGNVYEWVDDWYRAYPGNRFPNEHYGIKNKILRGGSWYDCLAYGCGMSAPVYNRARVTPKLKNNSTGFRCAADINE